jgi:dTDP-4-dehydrorhamnose 3,5-epimerase
VNVAAVAALARVAAANGITLVHVSSDYVFDGTADGHPEDEPFSPLGVYGQTKAAGDAIVQTAPRHYIVRTSWVIGDGNNFVRTMASLAARGVNPSVVGDQVGRLSFTSDLAAGIRHLLDTRAPYGTYNLTGSGTPLSWAEIARHVFAAVGSDPERVTAVTTAQYFSENPNFAGKAGAPRPLNSVLLLDKIASVGFTPRDQLVALDDYLSHD